MWVGTLVLYMFSTEYLTVLTWRYKETRRALDCGMIKSQAGIGTSLPNTKWVNYICLNLTVDPWHRRSESSLMVEKTIGTL